MDAEPKPGPLREPESQGRPRKRVWLPLLALLFLSPAIFSWIQMAHRPSNQPMGIRTIEWIKDHHFQWLADDAERFYYGWWHAPKKGGPGLKNCSATQTTTTDCFPSVGITTP